MGPRFKDDPARAELLALYAATDRILSSFSCDASTDCCHFERTGREPRPTAVEIAEVEHGVRAAGGLGALTKAGGKHLPLLQDEGRCPLLSQEGRCRIYASRPFGCRTFFCDRATSPTGGELPRKELLVLGRKIADLSAQSFARDPGPRTLGSAIERIRRGETVLSDRSQAMQVPPRGRRS